MKGYLILLKRIESDSVFFISKVHLRSLIQNLVKVCEIAESSNILTGGMEDFSTFDFLTNPHLYLSCKRPSKDFVHLNNPRLVEVVTDILHLLGSCQSFYIIADYLMEGIRNLER